MKKISENIGGGGARRMRMSSGARSAAWLVVAKEQSCASRAVLDRVMILRDARGASAEE